MRLLTGADIIDFYEGSYDLLVLDAAGDFTTLEIDNIAPEYVAYNEVKNPDEVVTDDGEAVTLLVTRSEIKGGHRFPDALDDDGALQPAAAQEMADLVNADRGVSLMVAVQEAREATADAEEAQAEADRRSLRRAQAVQRASDLSSQSHVAKALGLDQSTVNKLVQKARAAA